MEIKKIYEQIGSDYQRVFARLCSNEIIEKFAKAFPQDTSYNSFIKEYEAGNLEEAFRAVHTLKGICLNLGFDKLAQSSIEITEALRGGKNDVTPDMLAQLSKNYEMTIEAVKNID